ncbi:MAG: right-handed parallel beta-helix repeat-containing protein, partial [Minisyncoccales bacterium]
MLKRAFFSKPIILLTISLLLFAWASFVQAADCGNATSCQCGDTVVEDATLTQDLVCDETVAVGLTVKANLYLQANITMNKTDSQALLIDADGTSSAEHLIIEGNGTSTITGANSSEDYHIGVLIQAHNYITVRNLIFTHFNAGIGLIGASSSTIENNTTTENKFGIYLYNSSNANTLTNNTANGNGWSGISLYISSDNQLTGNYAEENGNFGIFLSGSSTNTLTNNTANNNTWHGIRLDYSSTNTLINNTANGNGWSGIVLYISSDNQLTGNYAEENGNFGIFLSGSSTNTLTNNTANNNTQYGIYLYNSSNTNTLTNNTANNNTWYGISLSSSSDNNLTGNKFIRNYVGYNNVTNNTSSNNQFIYNFLNNNIQLDETYNNINLNQLVDFVVTMLDFDNNECANCSYAVSLSPAETINTTQNGAQLTTSFSPTRSGIYSLIYTITDTTNGNITQAAIPFFVEATGSAQVRYYLRGILPTHGQPAGNGAKSLLLEPPTSTEEWTYGTWIQNSPDEIDENLPWLVNLLEIDTHTWYKIDPDGYIGVERIVTYGTTVDVDSFVPLAANYTNTTKTFSNLNWLINKVNWYYLAIKLRGGNPYWLSSPASTSYADFSYEYSTTPLVKNVENEYLV